MMYAIIGALDMMMGSGGRAIGRIARPFVTRFRAVVVGSMAKGRNRMGRWEGVSVAPRY